MRKVIGIGETILDIIFRGEQPTAAVPGGSVFNGIVSLGRIGVPICFISETGNDHVGNIILLNPVLRDKVVELLERAHDMHAIIYYDPNFRSSHKEEAIKLAPTIIENLEYANIVRGSQEDFFYMWGLQEADKIYKDKVKFYCRNFLCTAGAEQVSLRTGTISKEYSIPPLEAVSTIGAGDNFNAGIIFGLLKHNVRYEDLDTMDEATWDQVIQYGIEFAAEVCKSFNNSVSKEFAEARKYQP